MFVSLQEGLYALCAERIAGDLQFCAERPTPCTNAVDDALFDEYRLFQFKRTLKLVSEKSSFYRKLFAAAGVSADDIKSMEDIKKLPFTTSADISGSSFNFLCTSQGEVEKPVTFYSSGSTGIKKRIFFSKADIGRILEFLPRGMNTVIGRDEGRIQIFLQNSMGRGIGRILASGLENFGMQAWISALDEPVEDILKTTLDNRINVWFGDAITIFRTTRLLAQRLNPASLGMKCIFLTMANIPDCMIEYLEKTWNCRVSTHYGLTEMGWGLAVDCDVCDGYHYDELDVFAEVVDPESGEPLPDGETGELVLTSISRDCMPLIRYRTGDISSLKASTCGSHLRVMGHILRRREGAYELGGSTIFPAMFDEPLFETPEVVDYRLFADGDRLTVEVEVIGARPGLADEIAERLMQLAPLSRMERPTITLLPCGALREYCFEKKRIITGEATETRQGEDA